MKPLLLTTLLALGLSATALAQPGPDRKALRRDLGLSEEQSAKLEQALQQAQQRREQAREQLRQELNGMLNAEQRARFELMMPPPPPPGACACAEEPRGRDRREPAERPAAPKR